MDESPGTARTAAPVTPAPASSLVFVSYAHADRQFVERLVGDLAARGVACWVDRHGLRPGTPDWEQSLREAIRACRAVLLVASPDSRQSRYVKAELSVAELYSRPVFPLWAAGEQWIESIPLGLSTAQFVDVRGERYQAGLAEITAELEELRTPPTLLGRGEEDQNRVPPRNPYKGLRAFGEADVADFFGRRTAIAALVETLRDALLPVADRSARLLAVVGPSGSGKSSLLLAGLLPQLRRDALPGSAGWAYLTPIVPGARPLEALTVSLAGRLDRSMRAIGEDLTLDSGRGLHLLASRLVPRPNGHVLLLIDQAEELFTLTADEAERRLFLELLAAAVSEARGPLVVCLTVRADFYHQFMRYPDFWRLLQGHTHYVAPMSLEELREAIVAPATGEDVRLRFEGDLVGDLLFEVRDREAALPLLQFTLDQLVERRQGQLLSTAAYHALGGVRGALAAHAEETYLGLPSSAHRVLARALCLRLVEPGASEADITRRRVAREELALADAHRAAILREVAATLVGARLLSSSAVGGVQTLEVSHEALLRAWPRLRGWIQEDRAGLLLHRRLTEAAREWEGGDREEGLLYRGARLAAAQEWLARADGPALSASEVAFLEASEASKRREAREAEARQARELAAARALAHSERRRARVARTLSGVLSVVLVLALVATGVAVQQNRDAQAQRRQAETQRLQADASQRTALAERDATARANAALLAQQQATRAAQSHDLATSALIREQADPDLGILLASAAARLAPTGEAVGALARALAATPLQSTLRGHTAAVTALAFSPDGRRLVTAGDDTTARIWDTGSGRLLATLRGESQALSGVAFSPNGLLIATASEAGTARIWRADTGRLVRVLGLPVHDFTRALNSVAFSPDSLLVVTAGMDGTARVWQALGGRLMRTVGQGDNMLAATFNPAGTLLATAGDGYTARLWDVRSGRSMPLEGARDFRATNVHFDPSGAHLLGIGYVGPSRIWDVATGRLLGRLVTPGANVSAYDGTYSPNGALVVTAGADSEARVWHAATGGLVTTLSGHAGPVVAATFSPDGRRILTVATDRTARLWDTRSGQLLLTLSLSTEAAAFSPDGSLIATGSGDGTVRLWRTQPATPMIRLPKSGAVAWALWAGANPARVAAGVGGALGIWDARSGKLVRTIREPGGAIGFFLTNADGSLVATSAMSDTSQTLHVWRTATGRLLYALPNVPGLVGGCYVRFSTDGTLLFSVGCNGEVSVWRAGTGKLVATLHHVGMSAFMSISPDNRLALISSQEGTIRLWDLRTGRPIRTVLRFNNTEERVGHVFSPDGTLTVTANTSASGIARVWEVRTSRLVATLPTGPLNDVEFNADGRLLVTAGADDTAKVWDARTGRLLTTLTGHTGPVNIASFSPDGRWIATTSRDQTMRVWDARTGAMMEVFSDRLSGKIGAQWSANGGSVLISDPNGPAQVVTCDMCRPLPDLLAMADARVGRQLTALERATYMYGAPAQ